MSQLLELKRLSLSFRRISSNLLNSDSDNADVNLIRFIDYIDKTEIIHDILHNAIDGIEFDFTECFISQDSYGRCGINIPVDVSEHLKAQYDYAKWIIGTEKVCVWNQTLQLYRSYSTDKIQKFLCECFKPMIDYINDELSSLIMIEEDEEKKNTQASIYQNIEQNYGTINAQANGTIKSYNGITNVDNIISLIEKILSSLPQLTNIDADEIDSVKDDLEMVQEQLKTDNPKKNRIGKALVGIKKFAGDFSMKLAVTLAAGAVTGADWGMLLQQLENFIR